MTPKERAVMQQALEALIKANHFHDYEDEITALREALSEQAEQEPVGIVSENVVDGVVEWLGWVPQVGTKLYAAPVRTKDLTDDEERQIITATVEGVTVSELAMFKAVARAVIAADREKNK